MISSRLDCFVGMEVVLVDAENIVTPGMTILSAVVISTQVEEQTRRVAEGVLVGAIATCI